MRRQPQRCAGIGELQRELTKQDDLNQQKGHTSSEGLTMNFASQSAALSTSQPPIVHSAWTDGRCKVRRTTPHMTAR